MNNASVGVNKHPRCQWHQHQHYLVDNINQGYSYRVQLTVYTRSIVTRQGLQHVLKSMSSLYQIRSEQPRICQNQHRLPAELGPQDFSSVVLVVDRNLAAWSLWGDGWSAHLTSNHSISSAQHVPENWEMHASIHRSRKTEKTSDEREQDYPFHR